MKNRISRDINREYPEEFDENIFDYLDFFHLKVKQNEIAVIYQNNSILADIAGRGEYSLFYDSRLGIPMAEKIYAERKIIRL